MSKKDKNAIEDSDHSVLAEEFDTSIAALRKSLGLEDEETKTPDKPDLQKSKSSEMKGEAESDEEEEEEGEDGEEEGYEDAKKSIEASMADDPESEAAMDVEPFLRTLVKGIDAKFNALESFIKSKLDNQESLIKAQSSVMLAQSQLQKSLLDTAEKIGQQPIGSLSVRNKQGERFQKSTDKGDALDYSKVDTQQLLKAGKIDLTQATVIDNRIAKGSLFARNDEIDTMVKSLISTQEAK
jgi:hypothetical protein